MILPVLPQKQVQTDAEYRAYSADLRLRIGVELGRMSHDELTACSRRSVPPTLRNGARAELKRRERLS